MKYYLETNALRALGRSLGRNPELLKNSYTSMFSLFELAKGIDRKEDSERRFNILSSIARIELPLIDFMPFEVMRAAFSDEVDVLHSNTVGHRLSGLINGQEVESEVYEKLIQNYEEDTLLFKQGVTEISVRKRPESQEIVLNLDSMFARTTSQLPEGVRNLPQGAHPSRVVMESQKSSQIPAMYRALFNDADLSDLDILGRYNDRLDIFIFSSFTYMLRRNLLRESAAKNDWFDVLHSVYLHDFDKVMVSDDRIFESILPNVNLISVSEYKAMIGVSDECAESDVSVCPPQTP